MSLIEIEETEHKLAFLIKIDDEVWKTLDKRFYKRHLKDIRKCRSRDELIAFFSKHEPKIATAYLYRLLARRGYLKAQLRKKFEKRFISQVVIEKVLSSFEEKGYLDDEKEVELLIESGIRKHWGPRLIEQRVSQKGGFKMAKIREHLQNLGYYDAQIEHMHWWLEKKYRGLNFQDIKVKQKIFRFLKSKGFEESSIRGILLNS